MGKSHLPQSWKATVLANILVLPGDEPKVLTKTQIYDGYPDVALEMIGSRTFDGRSQLLEYVPTILAGPPSTASVTP